MERYSGQMAFNTGGRVSEQPASTNEEARAKVLHAKPAQGTEGCFDNDHFIAENLIFSSQPVSECSKLYPVYSSPRKEAGGPLAANILKCQLKPIDSADYTAPFSAVEIERMQTIFPGGVCDFAKPGVNQAPLVTWPSFGPSTEHLVWDSAKP